ncbi:MAG: hypothetical protein RLZZ303_882 [Candidatus Hydrogenedentota bacterium]|jgi:tetratricopeptide (TPR) repeat protein
MNSTALRALPWALLALVAVLPFSQAVGFDWLRYDDPQYVTENPHISGGLTWAGIQEAFGHGLNLLWIPVTSISYMLGVSLHGLHPAGHHLTNVLLHAVNTLLAFAAFRALHAPRWSALAAAALFAVHPLAAEPVAWISGRKDLLGATFWLGAIVAYARFAAAPTAPRMVLPLLLFALGIASKVTVIALPLVLIALDALAFRRLQSGTALPRCAALLVAEKLPMFLLGALVSWWAVQLHVNEGGIRSLEQVPMAVRVMNVVHVYAFHVVKFALPTGLTVHYPYLESGPPPLLLAAAATLLLGISVALLLVARRAPLALAGWLWFTMALLPSAGLARVDSFLTADRYAYVPMLGLALMVCALGQAQYEQLPSLRRPLLAALAGAVALYAGAAFVQAGHWRNDVSLFARAASLYPESPTILNGYGTALNRAGRREDARAVFERARAAQGPFRILPTMNLAMLCASEGDWDGARRYLQEVVGGNPEYLPAYAFLARVNRDEAAAEQNPERRQALERGARMAEAMSQIMARETKAKPDTDTAFTAEELSEAHRALASAYSQLGLLKQSFEHNAMAHQIYERARLESAPAQP